MRMREGKQAEAGENRPVSTGAECNQQAPEEGGAENGHRQVAERSGAQRLPVALS